MIIVSCRQGTPEWLQARSGAVTASRFADAISMVGGLTEQQQKYVDAIKGGASEKDAMQIADYKAVPKSAGIVRALSGEKVGEPSDTSERYAADLAIERISGMPYGEPPKTWLLDRGHELEDRARIVYESITGYLVEETGVCLTDDRKFGYSTDGMPEDDGLIEIKCPIDSIKIAAIWATGDVSEYMHQMQGGMWITGRKWCDFIMYVPDLANVGKDLYVKRIERDDAFIDAMVEELLAFDRRVEGYRARFSMSGGTHSIIVDEERVKAEAKAQAEQEARAAEERALAARQSAVLAAAQAQREQDVAAATQEQTASQHFADARPSPVRGIADLQRAAEKPSLSARQADSRPPIATGALCAMVGSGFAITEAFIRTELGINPTERPSGVKAGTYWAATDVPLIFRALAQHLQELAL